MLNYKIFHQNKGYKKLIHHYSKFMCKIYTTLFPHDLYRSYFQ